MTPEEIFKEHTGVDIEFKSDYTNLVIDKSEFLKMFDVIYNQAIKDAADSAEATTYSPIIGIPSIVVDSQSILKLLK